MRRKQNKNLKLLTNPFLGLNLNKKRKKIRRKVNKKTRKRRNKIKRKNA